MQFHTITHTIYCVQLLQMNKVMYNILNEYGVLSIFGDKLLDESTSNYVKKLSRKTLSRQKNKKHSPAFEIFSDTLYCGYDNHLRNDKGKYVVKTDYILQPAHTSPRFLVLVFKLEFKHMLDIPLVSSSRGRQKTTRNRRNLCTMLEEFLLEVFDDGEFDNIRNIFHKIRKNSMVSCWLA